MNKKQLDVLNRVHDFLRVLIKENLIKDAPFLEEEPMLQVCNLVDDVYDAIHNFPLLNCDVGTSEEQDIRFEEFCYSHYNINNVDDPCNECPLNEIKTECEFAWSQMPYEEEKEINK